jgi:MYXO-CTERM domain-containing protein
MNTAQKCLFGGALMAAGVANAQSFVFQDSANLPDGYGGYASFSSFAYLVDQFAGAYNVAYAPDSLTTNLSTQYLDLSTTQSSNLLRIGGTWNGTPYVGPYGVDDFGYGGGFIQQFFEVDQDADLIISWDVSATDLFTSAFVLTAPDGSTIFELDNLGTDPAAGSAVVSLVAGQQYGAVLQLQNGFFPFFEVADVEAFISAELVPAPGAAGLIGLAGLAATRRRRRA